MTATTPPGGWGRWSDGVLQANLAVVEEFRRTGGHPGGYFAGAPMLLLHHRGARTGTERVTPLVYVPDGPSMVVAASKGGSLHNPDWYHNLIAHARALVEVGDRILVVTAVEIHGDERDDFYRRLAEARPAFAGYERATARIIPMLRLVPDDRVGSGGGGRTSDQIP